MQDILDGPPEMATWFGIAEANVPSECKLILNEFGVISAAPPEVNAQQYITTRDAMVQNINTVLDNGGKLDRIGFQSRMKREDTSTLLWYMTA